jgi:hypothetical protein
MVASNEQDLSDRGIVESFSKLEYRVKRGEQWREFQLANLNGQANLLISVI